MKLNSREIEKNCEALINEIACAIQRKGLRGDRLRQVLPNFSASELSAIRTRNFATDHSFSLQRLIGAAEQLGVRVQVSLSIEREAA